MSAFTTTLADGRAYKYLTMDAGETVSGTLEIFKDGGIADVALTLTADGTDVVMSGTFEAGFSEETLSAQTEGITMLDPLTMTEEESEAFTDELSSVALSALFELASIPGIAALLG